MSWPSIWQNQNQTQNPSVANQQNIPAVNAMYLTPDQQQYMQQQSWQQWQIYNQQMAQWQAQYGDQVSFSFKFVFLFKFFFHRKIFSLS